MTPKAKAAFVAQQCQNPTLSADGERWQVRCPAHDDQQASLTISTGADKVLLYCHAGCPTENVLAAIGMRPADLFMPTIKGAGKARIVKVYRYLDMDGHVVHETVRYEPKSFRQRRPDPANPGQYIWNLRGIEPLLYRLPDVVKAIAADQPIYLCEGEKDADSLTVMGLAATTAPMGAGKWRPSYTEPLVGADVVIVPDNDSPGEAHAQTVARTLSGSAKSVKVLRLPGLPPKGDVSDWLAAGGTQQQLETLVSGTPEWAPTPGTYDIFGDDTPKAQRLHTPNQLPLSDYTNALAFLAEHGDVVRYCYAWGKWVVWDGTRWDSENPGAVLRMAKAVIKGMLPNADTVKDMDDIQLQALLRHIKSSLSTGKLKAMVENAESEPGVAVTPGELDQHPWLLNCQNGTVDLRTGLLQTHNRTHLITQYIDVAYDANAHCPTWETFLRDIMGGNDDMVRFLQRAVGYAATGVIREHVLFVLHGTGANGKSTFIDTLRALFGRYAIKAVSELLIATGNQDRHPTERADLYGKRLVCCVETDEGRRLHEVFVKEATGGDPIRARRMREDFWEFEPTHHIFLATNHRPIVRGTDNAIWRRIKLVPFQVTIPEDAQDKQLPEKLRAEFPGILRWVVEGCLSWQHNGLAYPAEVMQATQEYREDEDVMGDFIHERCVILRDATCKASSLYQEYVSWCEEGGERAMNQRRFGQAMTERGFTRQRDNGIRYLGIGLLAKNSDETRNERNERNEFSGCAT